MSWEYSRYEAKCEDCEHEGVCIQGDDDWGRSSTSWEGFDNVAPDSNEVYRKRTDSRESRPICKCGSKRIVVGKLIIG